MTEDIGTSSAFHVAQDHRRRLLTICEELVDLDGQLRTDQGDGLQQNRARIQSDAFKVMVVGEFKRGKSVLVNALLGDAILPSFAVPTTAVITEVKYAEQPVARLWPVGIDTPVDIPVAELGDRIRIDTEDPDRESPYWLAEVGWPIPLCRNGVVLIDSPGLNEHPDRERTTMDYLRRSDAIVVVQEVRTAMSLEEQRFVDAVLADYPHLIFAFNWINLIDPAERDEVCRVARRKVEAVRPGGRDEIFFVDAKAGLHARQTGDSKEWRESGMADFEASLTTYLVSERHRAKIFVPATSLQTAAVAMERHIPEELELLDAHGADLAARYEREREPLASLETQAAQLSESLTQAFDDLGHRVHGLVFDEIGHLAAAVPEIVTAYTPTTKIAMLHAKSSVESIAAEASEAAVHELRLRFNAWVRGDLGAVLEAELDRISGDFADRTSSYRDDLEGVRLRLTGVAMDADDTRQVVGRITADLGAGLSLPVDITGNGVALRHIAQQLGGAAAVTVVWLFTPLGVIPLVLAMAFAGKWVRARGSQALVRKVLDQVGDGIQAEITSHARGSAEEFVAALREALEPVLESTRAALSDELDQLRRNVESVLHLKQDGDAAVAQRRADLDQLRRRLSGCGAELDALLREVAMT